MKKPLRFLIGLEVNSIIKTNIESLLYPIKSIQQRLNNSNHLKETIVFLWSIYMFHLFFELVIFYFSGKNYFFSYWPVVLLLLKAIIFPFLQYVDSYVQFFILKLFFPESVRDGEIDAIVATSFVGGIFLIIPIAGELISYIVSKYLLFICSRRHCGVIQSALICLFPFFMSILFILFLILCLALFLMTLNALI